MMLIWLKIQIDFANSLHVPYIKQIVLFKKAHNALACSIVAIFLGSVWTPLPDAREILKFYSKFSSRNLRIFKR